MESENLPDHEVAETAWAAIPPLQVDRRGTGVLSERQARLWTLVLESRYLKGRAVWSGTEWQVLVPLENREAALRELRLFVEENRFWPPPLPTEHPLVENTLPTISVLILLATFYNLTQLDISLCGHHPVLWSELGEAHASLILRGEWWRLATALTLHADLMHLVSNLAFGALFIVYLCRDLGSGLAWALLLASGMLGNWANAYIQLPSHRSVGSSTMIFAAVGLLGALSMVRYRRHLQRRWPLPVAAALSLLALLGTEGKNTDIGAHLFGFAFGILLGIPTGLWIGQRGRPGRLAGSLLALASAAIVAVSWWLALRSE